MNTSIQLNFINRSDDGNTAEVVIFQQNVANSFNELSVAWMLIKDCAVEDNYPFTYSFGLGISASDAWGNYTPQLPAQEGHAYEIVNTGAGDEIRHQGPASGLKEVQLRNNLQKGSIGARIYRDGKLLAIKNKIAPGQKAVFEFKPHIYIGVVSGIEEGEVMDAAIISNIHSRISLLGLKSADIVMTGGGPNATDFRFFLDNEVYA